MEKSRTSEGQATVYGHGNHRHAIVIQVGSRIISKHTALYEQFFTVEGPHAALDPTRATHAVCIDSRNQERRESVPQNLSGADLPKCYFQPLDF